MIVAGSHSHKDDTSLPNPCHPWLKLPFFSVISATRFYYRLAKILLIL